MALAINTEGKKEVLGMWTSPTEGAKFWLGVATEWQNRGVSDIFICCAACSGFGDALEAVFQRPRVQCCVVHMIRSSLNFVVSVRRPSPCLSLCGDSCDFADDY